MSLASASGEFRKKLDAKDAEAQKRILQSYLSSTSSLNNQISVLVAKIQALKDEGKPITRTLLNQRLHIQNNLALIAIQFDKFGKDAQGIVQPLSVYGADLARTASERLMKEAIADTHGGITPATVAKQVPMKFSPKAVESILGQFSPEGPYLAHMSKYGAGAAAMFEQVFINAVVQGMNPLDAAAQLAKSLDIPLNSARTTSRTVMMTAYNESKIAYYSQNPNVVKAWRWAAARSARTCPVCLAMDGQEFPLDEPFGSHPNCRCHPEPVTATYSELLGLPVDESDRRQRPTGEEWFASQEETTQRDILGPGPYELWKSGQVTLRDFVGYEDDPDWGPQRFRRPMKDLLKPIPKGAFPN